MKKFVSLALIFSLLLAMLVCTSRGDSVDSEDTTADRSTDQTTEGNGEFDRLDELGEKDFNGREFVILDANDHPEIHVNLPGDTINGDIVNDSLYERDHAIEERYGVDIKYVQLTNAKNGTDTLKNTVLSDDDEYTICISTLLGGTLGAIAQDGVLMNLSEADYLSLDQSWWSRLLYDNLNLGGKMYYTTGDISPTMYQMAACIYLNTSLAEDYRIDTDFCQLVRDGKWTLDELISVTKDMDRDLNDDGVMHASDDFFGFIHQIGRLTTTTIAGSSGIKLSTINGDTLEVDLETERNISVIEKIQSLIIDINYADSNDVINKAFKEGRALTLMHYTESSAVFLRDMEDDYLILPMPKGDLEQDDYHTAVNAWANAFVAIPITSDPEFAGFITEALGYYSYKYIRPKAFELTYKTKNVRDENSAEMLNIVFDTLYIDFNTIYDFGGTTKTALTNAIKNGGLSSELASVKSKTDKEIESFVEAWLK